MDARQISQPAELQQESQRLGDVLVGRHPEPTAVGQRAESA